MAQAPSISVAAQNDAANAVVDRLDLASQAARMRIYAGTKPVDVNAALSGNTLLGELIMSDPAYGNAASGVATAAAIASDTSADATGTATFFRQGQWDGSTFTPELQGEIGVSGSDLNLTAVAIT